MNNSWFKNMTLWLIGAIGFVFVIFSVTGKKSRAVSNTNKLRDQQKKKDLLKIETVKKGIDKELKQAKKEEIKKISSDIKVTKLKIKELKSETTKVINNHKKVLKKIPKTSGMSAKLDALKNSINVHANG